MTSEEIPFDELMFCWNPGGDAKAVRWPDHVGRYTYLKRSDLACNTEWHEMDHFARVDKIWSVVGQMVVRDKVDARKVREMLVASGVIAQIERGPTDAG